MIVIVSVSVRVYSVSHIATSAFVKKVFLSLLFDLTAEIVGFLFPIVTGKADL